MFEVDMVDNVMILTPDVLRMNAAREQIIREHVASEKGVECVASIAKSGDQIYVELFAGTAHQRHSFKDELIKAVWG